MNAQTSPERENLPADLAWATYLLASWWEPGESLPAPAASADPASVVELLRRNGVPLLTLADDSRGAASSLLAAPPFQAAIAEHRAKMARQQAAFAEIRAGWAAVGIPALFVKAMGPRPTFPYISNNLDVLVPQPQQDAARKIVRDLGYVELRHIEEPNKFLFRRYHLGASAFDLHIHGRLEWHVEFVDSPTVWQRSACAPEGDLSSEQFPMPGSAPRPIKTAMGSHCEERSLRRSNPSHLQGIASGLRPLAMTQDRLLSGQALAAVPAPEDGLLIALAHAIYENKALKLIELAKVIYAARASDVDWDQVADGAQCKGWLPGLWFGLNLCDRLERQLYGTASLPAEVRGRIERGLPSRLTSYAASLFEGPPRAPVRIGFLQSKRLFYEKILADPSRTALGRAEDVVSHTLYGTRVKLQLHSQKPLLIALDGVDGSGKSAQAELFAEALEGAALRHRVVWTRGGSSTTLQPILKLGKRLIGNRSAPRIPPNSPDSPEQAREAERAALFRHPLVRALWPWLIAFELGVSYQARVRWPLLRGEVVVADRYVLSALIELGARLERPDIARTLAARLLRWMAPAPGRAYWLDVPAEVALARKEGREAPDFLRRQAELLPKLTEKSGTARLDGTQPADAISDRIITQTLRSYLDAHRTLLNGLFRANPRPLPSAWMAEDTSGLWEKPGQVGEPKP